MIKRVVVAGCRGADKLGERAWKTVEDKADIIMDSTDGWG